MEDRDELEANERLGEGTADVIGAANVLVDEAGDVRMSHEVQRVTISLGDNHDRLDLI